MNWRPTTSQRAFHLTSLALALYRRAEVTNRSPGSTRRPSCWRRPASGPAAPIIPSGLRQRHAVDDPAASRPDTEAAQGGARRAAGQHHGCCSKPMWPRPDRRPGRCEGRRRRRAPLPACRRGGGRDPRARCRPRARAVRGDRNTATSSTGSTRRAGPISLERWRRRGHVGTTRRSRPGTSAGTCGRCSPITARRATAARPAEPLATSVPR